MHMKMPDGIGREAGIGKTQHGEELSVCRACLWCPAFRRVTPRWSKRVAPPKIIVVVAVVVEYMIYYINIVVGKVIRPPIVFPL